jgi:hypothetical protein
MRRLTAAFALIGTLALVTSAQNADAASHVLPNGGSVSGVPDSLLCVDYWLCRYNVYSFGRRTFNRVELGLYWVEPEGAHDVRPVSPLRSPGRSTGDFRRGDPQTIERSIAPVSNLLSLVLARRHE